MTPLAIDLFCGLGGWTEGLLAEGWYVVGFDIERHEYGEHKYPAQLVIQDVLTLHGSQFRTADLIVASPPCQAYSYRAMPWSRAKALPPPDNSLFDACFRIQREACEAASRHIPLIVENVRGAQKWVGRSRWNYGSFHLWGDVPALMPMTKTLPKPWCCDEDDRENYEARRYAQTNGRKLGGGTVVDANGNRQISALWRSKAGQTSDGLADLLGVKQAGIGGVRNGAARHGSKSAARKAASAMIAKIPFPLSRYIAATFWPRTA